VLIAVLALGLPIALALAWSFDVRPATPAGQPSDSRAPRRAGINVYLVVVAIVAVGYILVDKLVLTPQAPPAAATAQPAPAVADRKSLAILPFKNLSAQGENQYFSDGVMEAILNELSLIRDLKVVSRTSVEAYRDTTKPIPQIARELDVANILEGSVQRAGNQVRVTAQLIAADDDKHLWSRNFDRDLSDIFAIQSEIATAIASNLELILTSEEREALTNAPTSELRAYDLYLRSQYGSYGDFLSERPPQEAREALGWCEEARDLDPEFALAYTCIATNLFYLGKSEYIPLSEWRDRALENLDRAVEINPRLWEAYALRSDIHAAMGEWPESVRFAEQVLEVNPNQPVYLMKIGFYRLRAGQAETGIDMILRSLELIPGSSVRSEAESVASSLMELAPGVANHLLQEYRILESPSIEMLHQLAGGALWDRNSAEYLRYQQEINRRLPTPNNRINLGLAHLFVGDYQRAREIYEEQLAVEAVPEAIFLKYPFKHRYAYALMQTGERERGLAMLLEYRDTLLEVASSGLQLHGNKGAYYDLAVIYCALGDIPEAEKWLRTAAEKSSEGAFFELYFVRGDTMLEPLRDSKFLAQIQQQVDQFTQARRDTFREMLAARQREGKLLWLEQD